MLNQEAQEFCRAGRYERSESRKDSRAGYYCRKLHTQAGEVELQVSNLRRQTATMTACPMSGKRNSICSRMILQMR
jgi:putative transposase